MTATSPPLFSEIEAVIKKLRIEDITAARKETLRPLVDYMQMKAALQKDIRLNLICTHNSRRSHLAQVWAQTAAAYYNIKNVYCYSGGTAATAVFPMIVNTLEDQGFNVKAVSDGSNPVYAIKYADNAHPIIAFSKTYCDDFNPKSGFAAVMTCSEADGECPFVSGAEIRIPITFEDPKAFDDTPQQAAKYEERSLQIATEMLYVFSQIKPNDVSN